ncbi:Thioesterase/thiol ester dehydrase-isomerase [Ceratobasidium sp. AG-I]|nr:Thioesterase/thiol ester dehydrase-isomerase [Ceratobasidium sp. AG-I]
MIKPTFLSGLLRSGTRELTGLSSHAYPNRLLRGNHVAPVVAGISALERTPNVRLYSAPSPAEPARNNVAEEVSKDKDPFEEARVLARGYAKEHGHDLTSLWEQNIAWGDLDSFRHLNNVNYVRYFETARMHMMYLIGLELQGAKGGKAMLEGLGVSIILKSIEVKFKRPVTYPDNLVIMQRPHNTSSSRFTLSSVAYSLAQRAPVATGEAVCVWYDYDVWKKAEVDESQGIGLAIAKRAKHAS